MLIRKKTIKMTTKKNVKDNIELYIMLAPVLVLIFIFSYIPLFGIVIAFQEYIPGLPFFGEGVNWVGIKHFKAFIDSFYFIRILKNTLVLNLLNLVMGFWVPIFFALLLNEMRTVKLRKFIQTVSYMPYFISAVVVAGMVLSFISDDGIVIKLTSILGFSLRSVNTKAEAFPFIYAITNVWKNFGWSSILYLSTISSIDPTLYEVAEIDGAHRLQKVWYITIPFMVPLIIIQLIFAIGSILHANAEMILLLYNPSIYSSADVIGTYVYREGLLGVRYSYGTAVGLLLSVMSFTLVYTANRTSRKFADFSLW